MNNFIEGFGVFVIALIIIVGTSLLMALPTMWLWNGCLIPAVDGFHEIGFWQALGLNVLFSILFKPTSAKSNNG